MVHWQQVCLRRAFLMRSHELSASAILDKHASDASGEQKNIYKGILHVFPFLLKMKRQTL